MHKLVCNLMLPLNHVLFQFTEKSRKNKKEDRKKMKSLGKFLIIFIVITLFNLGCTLLRDIKPPDMSSFKKDINPINLSVGVLTFEDLRPYKQCRLKTTTYSGWIFYPINFFVNIVAWVPIMKTSFMTRLEPRWIITRGWGSGENTFRWPTSSPPEDRFVEESTAEGISDYVFVCLRNSGKFKNLKRIPIHYKSITDIASIGKEYGVNVMVLGKIKNFHLLAKEKPIIGFDYRLRVEIECKIVSIEDPLNVIASSKILVEEPSHKEEKVGFSAALGAHVVSQEMQVACTDLVTYLIEQLDLVR